jgi:hypothetical protein
MAWSPQETAAADHESDVLSAMDRRLANRSAARSAPASLRPKSATGAVQ